MRTTHVRRLATPTRLFLAILVGCLLLADGFEATSGDLCGTTVVEDLKLESDLLPGRGPYRRSGWDTDQS
jgi:hypothetical protein